MPSPRMQLKKSILDLLDKVGREHPSGHQGAYANRYVVSAAGGRPVEVMFEKSERVPANIWCPAGVAKLVSDVPVKESLKVSLWQLKKGERQYGRHSGLRAMPQLAEADLVKFQPETVAQARKVVDAVLAFSARATL
jgi:hypothetical protein